MALLSIRCTDAQKSELEVLSHGNVSQYVKEKIFNENPDHSRLLNLILDRLDALESRQPQSKESSVNEGLLVEILLLLRLSQKPEHVRQAKSEVERLGLQVWSSDVAMTKKSKK